MSSQFASLSILVTEIWEVIRISTPLHLSRPWDDDGSMLWRILPAGAAVQERQRLLCNWYNDRGSAIAMVLWYLWSSNMAGKSTMEMEVFQWENNPQMDINGGFDIAMFDIVWSLKGIRLYHTFIAYSILQHIILYFHTTGAHGRSVVSHVGSVFRIQCVRVPMAELWQVFMNKEVHKEHLDQLERLGTSSVDLGCCL